MTFSEVWFESTLSLTCEIVSMIDIYRAQLSSVRSNINEGLARIINPLFNLLVNEYLGPGARAGKHCRYLRVLHSVNGILCTGTMGQHLDSSDSSDATSRGLGASTWQFAKNYALLKSEKDFFFSRRECSSTLLNCKWLKLRIRWG